MGHSPGVPSPGPVPLVVSLSRMRKVPLELPWHSSCRSASLRPIFPKYHLPRRGAQRQEGTTEPPCQPCGTAGLTRTPGPEAGGVGVSLPPLSPTTHSSAWMESTGAT